MTKRRKTDRDIEQEATRRLANLPKRPVYDGWPPEPPPPDLERLLRAREDRLRAALKPSPPEPAPPQDAYGVTVHGGFQFTRNPTVIWWRLLGAFSAGLAIGVMIGKHLL